MGSNPLEVTPYHVNVGKGQDEPVDLDVARVRASFPALDEGVAHFDGPGGSQVPTQVARAIADAMCAGLANRGSVTAAEKRADAIVVGARQAIADLVGCTAAGVVFGRSMTALTYDMARALAKEWGPRDEVVVTRLDHDANVRPWVQAAERAGATVRWAEFDPDSAELPVGAVAGQLGERTRLVAVTGASNLVGTRPDLAGIATAVHDVGALLFVDGVHLTPHAPVDVAALGADFLFCSPYKFFGPHMGFMFGRIDLLDGLRPYKVAPSSDHSPHRWETGTGNHEGMAGLVAAIDYIADLGSGHIEGATGLDRQPPGEGGFEGPDEGDPAPHSRLTGTDDRRAALIRAGRAIAGWETGLTVRWLEGLTLLPGVRLYGIADPGRPGERTPTFAVRVGDLHPRSVAEALGRAGIFVWDGNYYAQKLMARLDLEGSGGAVRIGFCHLNTLDEVDLVLDEIRRLSR